jgi:multicomponent Na+:H+ antiporter subunit G
MIGEALVALGAVLAALAALGAVRLDDMLARTHALTMAATGGIVLAILGATASLWSASATTTLALALALQLFTFPVGANLIAHAVHKRRREAETGAAGDGEIDGDEAP